MGHSNLAAGLKSSGKEGKGPEAIVDLGDHAVFFLFLLVAGVLCRVCSHASRVVAVRSIASAPGIGGECGVENEFKIFGFLGPFPYGGGAFRVSACSRFVDDVFDSFCTLPFREQPLVLCVCRPQLQFDF